MCNDCATETPKKKFIIVIGPNVTMVTAMTTEEAVRNFAQNNRLAFGTKISIMEWTAPTVFQVDVATQTPVVNPTAVK